MKRPWPIVLMVTGVVGAYVAGCRAERGAHQAAMEAAGHQTQALRALIADLQRRGDSLRAVAAQRDTVYLASAIRWRERVRVDTLPVEVPVEVIREVAARNDSLADSTINACSAARAACVLRAANAEALAAILARQDTVQRLEVVWWQGQARSAHRRGLAAGLLAGAAAVKALEVVLSLVGRPHSDQ